MNPLDGGCIRAAAVLYLVRVEIFSALEVFAGRGDEFILTNKE
jgi:hypothetical protein